jgi:tetratricopeptide (TPR) repeat protein
MKIIFLWFQVLALSVSADSLFNEANQAYEQKNYRNAIELYEESIDSEGESAATYNNLAEAYYKNDRWGLAILNFEKALLISPGNENYRQSLSVAESKRIDHQGDVDYKPLSIVEKALYKFSINSLLIVTLLVLFAFVVLFWFFKGRKTSRWVYPVGFVLIISSMPILGTLGYRIFLFENQNAAIILENNVSLKEKFSNDFKSNKTIMSVNEGTKVLVLNNLDGVVQIKVGDKIGYVRYSSLNPILLK